jgi:single-stranded-DNA-specific exonuclease
MAQDRRLFLEVESSVTGRRWIDRLTIEADNRAQALSQSHDMPQLLARVLAGRNIAGDQVEQFLNPSLRAQMPDPANLQDMTAAIDRLAEAIGKGETIGLFGDYDVDGACAVALMTRYAHAIGQPTVFYIPDRLSEGYGPNDKGFEALVEQGAGLTVTVDCGTHAHDPIAKARDRGIDVIVIDHHLAGTDLPRARAVVNPKRHDDRSGLDHLCAAGLVFLLLAGLNRRLRQDGHFGAQLEEPDLMGLLDLVALATVCDVVPLSGLNRAFVAQGLKIMRQRQNPGLAALADVAGLKRRPDTHALGFILGPRLNAGGRLGAADLGALLLGEHDLSRAQRLAARLDQLNKQRQEIEDSVLTPALTQAEHALGEHANTRTIVVAGDNWHAGVLGIVASRLKDRFHRPAVVIGFDETGTGHGSGRSVAGLDLGGAVTRAREAGILTKGGGHVMAAGLTVTRDRLGEFRGFLEDAFADADFDPNRPPELAIDGALSAGGADLSLITALEAAGPYGPGNPRPRFALPAHRVVWADPVGTGHVRCTLASGDGSRIKAIAFRAADGPLGALLLNDRHMPLHLAGSLSIDDWGGARKPQFMIEDAARPVG